MPQGAGHSRQKSDDFKGSFGRDEACEDHLETFELSETLLGRHSVTFRKPSFRCLQGARAVAKKIRHLTWRPVLFCTTRTIPSVLLLAVAIVIPIVLGVVTLLMYTPKVDMSLESFSIPNHVASRHQDAFTVAKRYSYSWKQTMRKKRAAEPWPLPESENPEPTSKPDFTQTNAKWTIDLVYLAKGKGELNMFTKKRLRAIHKLEQNIMRQEGMQDFCWKWNYAKLDPILVQRYNACTPPLSLVDFFFPTYGFFDGQGDDSKLTDESIGRTLKFLLSRQFTYWFVDGNFSVLNQKSSFLRAQIKFGYPLKGYPKKSSRSLFVEQHKKFINYMKKFIQFLDTQSTDEVSILYGGPEVYDHLVDEALWKDVDLAKYTLTLIILLMFILTSCSFLLTFFGILSILASLPLACFFFRVVFGVPTFSILSATSLFVIIGIGVDDVFVFINTFHHAENAKDIVTRLKHTISTAAGATFFTSFTTAAAFGANCFSKIPAIHDFGLFMMLIVISCWLTVVLIIPPTLYLWYRYVARLETLLWNLLFSWLQASCCKTSAAPQLPVDIQHFLSGESEAPSSPALDIENTAIDAVTGSRMQVSFPEQEDIPLNDSLDDRTSLNSDMLCLSDDLINDNDSAPLLSTCSTVATQLNLGAAHQTNASRNCMLRLQLGLYHLARFVYRIRYVLLVIYLAILGSSAYLNTKITSSEKPPAFFKEGSNLQQLLDLKYNMSGDNYDCKICDDIVQDASNYIISRPTKPATINSNALPPDIPTKASSNNLQPDEPTTAAALKGTLSSHVAGNKTTSAVPGSSRKSRVIGSIKTTKRPATQKALTTLPPTYTTLNPATDQTSAQPTTTHVSTILATTPFHTSASRFEGNDVNDAMNESSVMPTFDPCLGTSCDKVAEKPILDSMAIVYVVFGIEDIDRSNVDKEHVLSSKGDVVMDALFTRFILEHRSQFVKHMCRICKAFSNNKELVREAGANCFPEWLSNILMSNRYNMFEECRDLHKHQTLAGRSHAGMYYKNTNRPVYHNSTRAYWLAMAFETTTNKGSSSKVVLQQYHKWNAFLKEQVQDIPELQSAFHTSEDWVHMFMEVVAVNGAIYGIVFSLILCMVAVVIFTGHILLSIIVMLTILGVLCLVVGVFYLVGWHLGAVEAISLSILVGTSVDYCVHLIDGYIIAGRFIPDSGLSNKEVRRWRASAAISHIGSSILSSAVTTIVAAVPLCLTTIQIFAKFGQILAINTAVSILYTLTFCIALIALIAPARFIRSLKSRLFAVLGVALFGGMSLLLMYIASLMGAVIQGPDGNPLYNV
ncbi:protein dispatched homolog 3 [Nematostella vectensis]|uniref:protein dispatched homolog 3 n=1 Tax=Nematostella vectensis TaxID=45351 RepID=UPI0013905673|nr:protein dispatched homolog 3 [Nematostella vectensis]